MYCEYSVFSFCTVVPLSVISFLFWNYEFTLKMLAYGTQLGNVKFGKKSLEIDTTCGKFNIPTITLPSYDWSVGFFLEDIEFEDGFQEWSVLENRRKLECHIVRNKLVCQYMYPNQVNGQSKIRGYVGSMFDGECYIFTVDEGKPIDYTKFCNELMLHLEDL